MIIHWDASWDTLWDKIIRGRYNLPRIIFEFRRDLIRECIHKLVHLLSNALVNQFSIVGGHSCVGMSNHYPNTYLITFSFKTEIGE